MAMTVYLKVTGKNQGAIDGDCTQKGREKLILCYEFAHDIEIPRDTHTGLPSGQRIHHPLKLTTHLGPHAPKLEQACCSGEHVDAELDFYRINEKGQEEHYYTIKMQDAILVQTRNYFPKTFLEENKPYLHMMEMEFTYETIIWTYEIDGIEAEDSWKTPAS